MLFPQIRHVMPVKAAIELAGSGSLAIHTVNDMTVTTVVIVSRTRVSRRHDEVRAMSDSSKTRG
jgi:hypothetical protein